MKCEVWKDKNGDFAMFPETHSPEQKALIAGEDPVLLTVIEADNWDDAMRQYHEYMGFEPYVPMED